MLPREEARQFLLDQGETFKVEVVDNLPDEAEISFYRIGDEWWDLCAGPHLESTGKISPKAVALESVAGAYWRGDENREMLTRIYGTAWPEAWQLKEHKRRHGGGEETRPSVTKKLDLFSIQEQAGGGLCFWHPRGARVRGLMEQAERFAREGEAVTTVYPTSRTSSSGRRAATSTLCGRHVRPDGRCYLCGNQLRRHQRDGVCAMAWRSTPSTRRRPPYSLVDFTGVGRSSTSR